MAQKPHNVRVHIPEALKLTSDDQEGLRHLIKAQLAGYAVKSSQKSGDSPLSETNITSVGKRKTSKKSGKGSSKKKKNG